ncbi:ABC transporter permease [Fictibacillus terranigra]|uniref:ABC transporter permease subunit n=1 Tax=Fictibacillus terranigra TaxID=3058424 RepID=A0ABT8E7S1_9BACL|nr:ABC transporter permease subunit [Fictibacillus sp. CENA-BCM004]MDN4073967.1 ABC transporter permease subunit [Fictibacillus sp. CENA-BCM004]
MSNFIGLIRNENMKIYRRIANLIMLALLIGFIGLNGIITKTEKSAPVKDNWKQELKAENASMEKTMKKEPMMKEHYERLIAINEYRISQGIKPQENKNQWKFVSDSPDAIQFILIFTIIIAGGMVASEFSWGTIKLLLIRPVSRTTILASKYISTLLYALLMIVITFVISWLLGGVLFGFEGSPRSFLSYTDGKVVEENLIWHMWKEYGFASIMLLMMATFAFMMSTVFRNSSLAIGFSIFLSLSGTLIVQFFSSYDWVKYILFANVNLKQYFDGTPFIKGMTLNFSLTVLAVYFLVFIALTWIVFKKRDVAA